MSTHHNRQPHSLTIIVWTDHHTTSLARRNGLLNRKHSRSQRPNALRIQNLRSSSSRSRQGNLDGISVSRHARCLKCSRVLATLLDDGGDGVDVSEGDLDEDPATEEGNVACAQSDGLEC